MTISTNTHTRQPFVIIRMALLAMVISGLPLISTTHVFAQPGEAPPPPPQTESGQDEHRPGDTEPTEQQRRDRLRRTLELSQTQIQRALKMLEEGKPVDEIREEFPTLAGLQRMNRFMGRRDFRENEPDGQPDGRDNNKNDSGIPMPGRGMNSAEFDDASLDRLGPVPMPRNFGQMLGGNPRKNTSPREHNDARPGEPPHDQNQPPHSPQPPQDHGTPAQPSPNAPLSQTQRDAVKEFLLAAAPELHAKLKKLEEQDPAEAQKRWDDAYPRVRWLLEVRERQPDLYALRLDDLRSGREAIEAVRRIVRFEQSAGKGDNKPKIEESMGLLRKALSAQYHTRTMTLQLELKRLQANLEKAQTQAATRDERELVVIERNITELLSKERERANKRPGPSDKRRPGDVEPPAR